MNAGISRSGRLRKKSTKLIEMEESEKVGDSQFVANADKNSLKTPKTSLLVNNNCSSILQTNDDSESDRSLKKNLKIKLSLAGRSIDEIGNCVTDDTRKAVVPPVKIKLLGNSTKIGEAAIVSSLNTNSVKKAVKKSPVKSEHDSATVNSNNSAHKSFKINKKVTDTESAANLLFKQITAGVAANDGLKRRKKSKNDDVYFGSDDNFDGDETSLVIEDSNHSLAAAVANAKKVKNPKTPKTSVEKREERKAKQQKRAESRANAQDGKEKKKRAPLITAYTLFARENRPKIHDIDPDLDFSALSKRLGEIWQSLPPKEKMLWKKRALKLKEGNAVQETENNVSVSKPRNSTPVHTPSRISQRHATSTLSLPSKSTLEKTSNLLSQNEEPHIIGTGPSDVAAHLRLLGESLSIIGQRLTEHSGQIAVSGSLSVLLDSTVCALGPLLCLTTLDENLNGCPQEVHKQTLDNISYIMPGI
ncbi:HMG box-containing protein 4-like protein [Leptotrombidium deliense]|uniref:HMG box-containing protein 4-like protein n=1 Tax=Leptotrombidium deliense TaxID=299467 RepID=A0A443SGV2_9ACAR|nr:HMG box-containing protein 4-like protein [Leptotrombidium deliense]